MRLRSFLFLSLLCFASPSLVACTAGDGLDGEETDTAEDALGSGPPTVLVEPTAGSEATTIRAGGMTVWIDRLAKTDAAGADVVTTMRLRASRSLESAMSWVPDDGFGNARLVSPRVVEVDLRGGHEINSILSGLPLFVHLRTKSGAVREYDVRLDLAPRFARFSGSSTLFVHEAIKPVWVRRGNDSLHYRGKAKHAGATAMSVFTDDDADPIVTKLAAGEFAFDWSYESFELAFDRPEDPVYFSTTIGGQTKAKEAGIDLALVRVGLTKEGADRAWPIEACKPAVKSCVVQAGGIAASDLSACGLYREVSRCIDSLSCEPSVTDRAASSSLGAAKTAYNAACPNGGTWCSVGAIATYDVGGCEDAATIDQVAAAIASASQTQHDLAGGTTLTRAELAQRSTFASHGGPQLLAAIDAHVGTTNVIAKELVSEVPCPNCTERSLRYVLFYVDTQVVVVVDATSGWDS